MHIERGTLEMLLIESTSMYLKESMMGLPPLNITGSPKHTSPTMMAETIAEIAWTIMKLSAYENCDKLIILSVSLILVCLSSMMVCMINLMPRELREVIMKAVKVASEFKVYY